LTKILSLVAAKVLNAYTFYPGKFNAASYASSSGFTSGPRRGAYSEAAVEELLMEAGAYRRDRGIDVLLTSEWGERS
jgi:hypothetical protein